MDLGNVRKNDKIVKGNLFMNLKKTFIQTLCFSLIINFASLHAPMRRTYTQPTPKKSVTAPVVAKPIVNPIPKVITKPVVTPVAKIVPKTIVKPIATVVPSAVVTPVKTVIQKPTTSPALINLTAGQTLTSFLYQPQFFSSTNGTLTIDLFLSDTNLSKINALLAAGTSATINISLVATGNNNFQATVQALNATNKTVICSQVFTKLSTSTSKYIIFVVKPSEATPKTGQILYITPASTKAITTTNASTSWIARLIGGYVKKPWPTNPNLTEYVQSFTIQANSISTAT